jgi:hypothetical protein
MQKCRNAGMQERAAISQSLKKARLNGKQHTCTGAIHAPARKQASFCISHLGLIFAPGTDTETFLAVL